MKTPDQVVPGVGAGVGEKGVPNASAATPEKITKAAESKDVNFLVKNIEMVPDKSLSKDLAFQMAGMTDASGNPVKGQMGGSPKVALREFDKFENLDPNEFAAALVKSDGNAFAVFGLEDDLSDAEAKRKRAEEQLAKLKGEGYKEGDPETKDATSLLDNLSRLAGKIKKVVETLDKGALLDTAIATKNLLTPDRFKYFKKGEKKSDITSEELISKLLDAGYSSGYLRGFVENAEDGSISPALAERLVKTDEIVLGNIKTSYPGKFKE